MTKQSTITNLLVIPLIASTVFLASPALASRTTRAAHSEVRNITKEEHTSNTKRSIVGTVASISGTIILVTGKNNVQYTVDASHATIMKASDKSHRNPSIVHISNIKVGDAIMVRGKLNHSLD